MIFQASNQGFHGSCSKVKRVIAIPGCPYRHPPWIGLALCRLDAAQRDPKAFHKKRYMLEMHMLVPRMGNIVANKVDITSSSGACVRQRLSRSETAGDQCASGSSATAKMKLHSRADSVNVRTEGDHQVRLYNEQFRLSIFLVYTCWLVANSSLHNFLLLLTQLCGNTWPGISIVLPVKGFRKHSLQNWNSQLHSKYSGPVEYLFVVDSQVSCVSQTLQLPGRLGPLIPVCRKALTGHCFFRRLTQLILQSAHC